MQFFYIYLSLDAFNSRTASLKDAPRRVLARHKILVVFPVPGGPCKTNNKKQKHYFPNIPFSREPTVLQKSPFRFNTLLEIKCLCSILKWIRLKIHLTKEGLFIRENIKEGLWKYLQQ